MASLTGNSVASTYQSLIKISNNDPLDGTLRNLTDGDGTSIQIQANTAGVKFTGNADFTSATVTGITDNNTTYDLTSAQSTNDVDVNLVPSTGATDTIKFVAGTNITLTDNGSNQVTIDSSGGSGTTYDLTSAQATNDVNINLVPSSGVTDTVTLVAGTNITLTDNGTNQVTIDAAGGGSGTPGGSDAQIQYNNGGAFGGTSQLTYNDSTNEVFIGGSGGLNLSAGANLAIVQGNITMTEGDITMTDGSIEVSGSVTVAEGNNVIMTTGGTVSFDNSIGSFKADGITWPDAMNWGETADTVGTGETFETATAIATTSGLIYNLRPSVGGWALADADTQDSAGGLLGVSMNGGTVSRFFTRGLISIQSTNVEGTSTSVGDIVYLSEEGGHFDTDAPSGAGDVVRKLGQIVDSFVSGRTTYWKIWFDPDWYYTTV